MQRNNNAITLKSNLMSLISFQLHSIETSIRKQVRNIKKHVGPVRDIRKQVRNIKKQIGKQARNIKKQVGNKQETLRNK